MNNVVAVDDLTFDVSDVTGQRQTRARAPADATIGELVRRLTAELGLKAQDGAGNDFVYRARLEREGRNLNASERTGDALQTNDRLVLQPNVDAG